MLIIHSYSVRITPRTSDRLTSGKAHCYPVSNVSMSAGVGRLSSFLATILERRALNLFKQAKSSNYENFATTFSFKAHLKRFNFAVNRLTVPIIIRQENGPQKAIIASESRFLLYPKG
ncbi:hypothetical protein HEQ45_08235 [Lactobacillus sp. ZJLC29-4]|nr:hypothetical protein [Lactobacillus sp. HBUAS51387]